MNIYEKLQLMRVQLQRKNIKKTGDNKFSGYKYYELADFLPVINEMMYENKVSSFVFFQKDMAYLHLVNSEKPEEVIIFSSPMSDAKLKACHEVQNLGAVQTYIRRYLYTTAFEIVEHDVLDPTSGIDEEEKKPKENGNKPYADDVKKPLPNAEMKTPVNSELITHPQRKKLFATAKGDQQLLKEVINNFGYSRSDEIKKSEFDPILKEITKRLLNSEEENLFKIYEAEVV